MQIYGESAKTVAERFGSDLKRGLNEKTVRENAMRYGANVITERKQKGIVKRVIDALLEPMMIILCFALVITFGINIGKFIKGGDADFYECLGILIAISISVALTVVMEGKSQRAFRLLNKLGDDCAVKVLRSGKETVIKKSQLVVGDIMILESGDKISADALIIDCFDFSADESMLTGESKPSKKNNLPILKENASISEIKNVVFSGSFVCSGYATAIVFGVGDKAETGKLAQDVLREKSVSAPLEEKLSRLGKTVTIFGTIAATLVFALSVIRLALLGELSFLSVENVFVEAVVLIVAAVPEGLPTTVAISLTLNVVKLARSNALIKKLVATETVGCVSVICSDKTGTLTQNKMLVDRFVAGGVEFPPEKLSFGALALNCAVNSTAVFENNEVRGSATEGALLFALAAAKKDCERLRADFSVEKVEPFTSEKKTMRTVGVFNGKRYDLIKGAPEKILALCSMPADKRRNILEEIAVFQRQGKRALAFCHGDGGAYRFDGFAVISDKLRSDVKKSVSECVRAGVRVKILTGDNVETARSIARDLELACGNRNVVTADEIDALSDSELCSLLPDITVIARSSPKTKLKVVKALQSMGEVVAVTGDGVNDAPAVKHADIGIAMGSGSEITKEAGDIVLLDDSFSTILNAISFGRNVYGNLQRFITFQLTVNLASMSIIIAYLIMGFKSPFTSTCLLWLNVIMDGPLALSLGLEQRPLDTLKGNIVKRSDDILSKKMMARIVIHSAFMCLIVTIQKLYNFLGAEVGQESTVVISMFVFFQLFNAINCREVLSASVFGSAFKNRLFTITFLATFALHVTIAEVFPSFFGTAHLEFSLWLKIVLVCSSVVAFSEIYKFIYRLFVDKKRVKMAKFGVIESKSVA